MLTKPNSQSVVFKACLVVQVDMASLNLVTLQQQHNSACPDSLCYVAGGGMAEGTAAARLHRMGMPLIHPSQGLAALSAILSSQPAPLIVAAVPFHWDNFLLQVQNKQHSMFAEFAAQPTAQPQEQPQQMHSPDYPGSARTTVTAAAQAEAVVLSVQSTISNVLGSSVSSNAPLMAAGLDSLGMVELRNALQTRLGLQLPSTLVFDHPTADDITAYITAQLPPPMAQESTSQQRASSNNALELTPPHSSQQQQQLQQQQSMQHGVASDAAAMVQEAVAGVLGSMPSVDTPLMAAGLDSLGTVEVRNALQTRLGLQLPSTLLFDYPTVAAITAFLNQQLASRADTAPVQHTAAGGAISIASKRDQTWQQTFAVTAMVTVAPQAALNSPVAQDTVTQVPLNRWDVDHPPEGLFTGPAVRFGSYLSNPAAFDTAAFSTSDAEAVLMDPQQRFLLQSTAEALTASQLLGHSPATDDASHMGRTNHVGIFVGVSSSDYAMLVRQHSRGVSAYTTTGRAASVTSGRLSYTFGLKGPSLTVDTACSSSLVSLHMALNSLLLGQCSVACNSGVNLMTSPETPAAFQKAGMLSAVGRCKTLDSTADGYARAEACGSMVLQNAAQVESLGQSSLDVVALLRGSAVNQDGRSSSLTAPNGPSQQAVIRQALQAAALEPSQVQAIQLHGTGDITSSAHHMCRLLMMRLTKCGIQ